MLLKLLKHEMKATFKTFVAMFVAIIIITIFNAIGIQTENDLLLGLSIAASGIAFVAVSVIFAVTIFQRYHNNLYGDEGYLMFTLPVKSWQIILSKLFSAFLWGMSTALVSGLCVLFIVFITFTKADLNFVEDFSTMMYELNRVYGIKWAIIFSLLLILSTTCFIMKVYFVISFANLPFIRKYNVVIGIIAYFILGRIEVFFSNIIFNPLLFESEAFTVQDVLFLMEFLSTSMVMAILVVIVTMIVYFFLTSYITSRKLHIK